MYKFILIFIVFFLVGCSPKYVTKNQYIAPKDKDFSQCVNKCEIKKKECIRESNKEYKTCLNTAYLRAKEISDGQFIKYDRDYEDFLLEFRDFKNYKYIFDKDYRKIVSDYNYFLKECHSKKDSFTCRRKDELKQSLSLMKRDMVKEPKEPKIPSFSAILKSQQNLCRLDNSCSTSFDICYVNCGGKVIPYRLCINNCDK